MVESDPNELESKLIPIMRESIDVVKMIFYKNLKDHLSSKYSNMDSGHISKLSGGIVNKLFETQNLEEPFATFARENQTIIDNELHCIAADLKEMCIPLTDALRMQVLCDKMEGIDTSSILARAKELNILLQDRDLPLPHTFITLVRKLGSGFNILKEMKPKDKTH